MSRLIALALGVVSVGALQVVPLAAQVDAGLDALAALPPSIPTLPTPATVQATAATVQAGAASALDALQSVARPSQLDAGLDALAALPSSIPTLPSATALHAAATSVQAAAARAANALALPLAADLQGGASSLSSAASSAASSASSSAQSTIDAAAAAAATALFGLTDAVVDTGPLGALLLLFALRSLFVESSASSQLRQKSRPVEQTRFAHTSAPLLCLSPLFVSSGLPPFFRLLVLPPRFGRRVACFSPFLLAHTYTRWWCTHRTHSLYAPTPSIHFHASHIASSSNCSFCSFFSCYSLLRSESAEAEARLESEASLLKSRLAHAEADASRLSAERDAAVASCNLASELVASVLSAKRRAEVRAQALGAPIERMQAELDEERDALKAAERAAAEEAKATIDALPRHLVPPYPPPTPLLPPPYPPP
jgi:hypothetical protein